MLGILTLVLILTGVLSIVIANKFFDEYDNEYIALIVSGIFLIVMCWMPSMLIYETTTVPTIEAQLHQQCRQEGYDTFESWNGIGLYPTEPIYVKCKLYDNTIQGSLNVNGGLE